MFKRLYNEAVISFEMKTVSPLFINSGDSDQLDPAAADNTFLVMYRNGELVPVIPGSSLKGVFRSSIEQLLPGSCDIFENPCARRIRQKEREQGRKQQEEGFELGKERYRESCPACKMFGSTMIKSRISFMDAYPKGDYRIGHRASAAIDRITGATRRNALFEFEYVEDALFKCEIRFRNFFRWHIKAVLEVFNRINQGFVTFGGLTSKGFGQMKIQNVSLKVKYYDRNKKTQDYTDQSLFIEREIDGLENILSLFEDVVITDNAVLQGCDLENDKAV